MGSLDRPQWERDSDGVWREPGRHLGSYVYLPEDWTPTDDPFREEPNLRKRAAKRASLKKRYGISYPEFVKKRDEQGHCCKICGRPARLSVDHNHKTNKVRDLLCRKCNSGLGFFDENTEVMLQAINYLESHNQ